LLAGAVVGTSTGFSTGISATTATSAMDAVEQPLGSAVARGVSQNGGGGGDRV
jgi:hypothetical protein